MSSEVRVIGQGRHATIFAVHNGAPTGRWSARKAVSAPRSGRTACSQPHDIVKEVKILREVDHPNVMSLVGYAYDERLLEHHLLLPLCPLSLRGLLDQRTRLEHDLLKSVAFQTLLGLAHLHAAGVAHRDVKADNIMIDWDGTVKVMDFGTAWTGGDEEDERELPWRETSEGMCYSVGTGAPELLFSPPSYDPFAIDIWAFGVTMSDCLGPPIEAYDDDSPDSECGSSVDPLETEDQSEPSSRARHLFDDSYGELGLAASIFRIMGSPDKAHWPEFRSLPDAGKIEFVESTPRPLVDYYPDAEPLSLDLLFTMLQLAPERRATAEAALRHPYFHGTLVPLISQAWFGKEKRVDLSARCVEAQDGKRLVDLLEPEMREKRLE